MLHVLSCAEDQIGDLLAERAAWRSKYIDYSPPITERLYRDWEHEGTPYRISLHRIHPCERAFFHPHPWSSAVRVLRVPGSTYEMGVGFSPSDRHDPPPHAAVLQVTGGFRYEMTHPDGWHHVRVTGEPSVSLMVSGVPWGRSAPRTESRVFRPLTDDEQDVILRRVRTSYEER